MSRRIRILACDQDAAVNGAIGHLLGVAFRTPALLDQRTHSASVEIIGDYVIASPLMAPLQGERFAASAYSRRPFAPKPSAVVTLSGVGDVMRDTVLKLNVPVVCLSELSMANSSADVGMERFVCPLDHACQDCVTREFGNTVDSMRIAELCLQFATVFARDFGRSEG